MKTTYDPAPPKPGRLRLMVEAALAWLVLFIAAHPLSRRQ
jgi:hypothetical protein